VIKCNVGKEIGIHVEVEGIHNDLHGDLANICYKVCESIKEGMIDAGMDSEEAAELAITTMESVAANVISRLIFVEAGNDDFDVIANNGEVIFDKISDAVDAFAVDLTNEIDEQKLEIDVTHDIRH